MKMHILSGGRLRMRKGVYLPVDDPAETIELPVLSVLLLHAQGNVLFDTGCHPSVLRDPQGRWGGLARLMTPIMAEGENVLTGLACLGLEPDDIDVVVCSHLHPDHCGCNAFFAKATVVVAKAELAAARQPNAESWGYLEADWDHPLPTDELEGERDLFGDGRIVLLSLPGHTPGSTGALVRLERDGAFLLASDALPLRECLDRDILPKNTWNRDVLAGTFDEIRRIETQGATIVCGHDAAQWERLRKGAEAYE